MPEASERENIRVERARAWNINVKLLFSCVSVKNRRLLRAVLHLLPMSVLQLLSLQVEPSFPAADAELGPAAGVGPIRASFVAWAACN